MSSFTAGPWTVEVGTIGACIRATAIPAWRRQDEEIIASITPAHGSRQSLMLANARLIAAAPDLYAALRALVDTIDSLGTQQGAKMDLARAALAKADGAEGDGLCLPNVRHAHSDDSHESTGRVNDCPICRGEPELAKADGSSK